MVFGFVHSLLFIAWHFETASFYSQGMVLELARLEKNKKEIKTMTTFDPLKLCSLGFCRVELKSEDRYQRSR